MNLRSNIKKVLMESTFFRRRVDMRLVEKEFYENLNYATDGFISKLKKGISFDFDVFKRIVMHNLMDDYHNDLSDGGLNEFPYDEIYEFLSDHFHDKIKDRYDLIVSRNINESKIPPSVNRRLHYVDEYINNLDPNDVCEYWTVDEVNEYTNGTLIEIIRTIIGDSSGIDSDNYGSIYDVIYEFLVNSNYTEQIRDFFFDSMDNCGNVLNESKTLQENEEKTNKNVNLVKQIIYDFFDEVTSIEVSEYDDKPKLIVHLYSNSRAANIKSWFDENISNEVMQMTGGHIVVCPYWTPDWDFRKKIVDIYIDTRVRRI